MGIGQRAPSVRLEEEKEIRNSVKLRVITNKLCV
jgi:hypothetical protein